MNEVDPKDIVYDKLDPTTFRYRISKLLGVRIPRFGYGKIIRELETKGAFSFRSQTALIIFTLQYLEDLENAFKIWADITNKLNEHKDPISKEVDPRIDILAQDISELRNKVRSLEKKAKHETTANS